MVDFNKFVKDAIAPPVTPFVVKSAPVDFSVASNDKPLVIDGVEFPHEAAARIRAMSKEEYQAWTEARLRARTDPIFLARELCEMDLVENPHLALFQNLIPLKVGVPLSDLDPIFKRRLLLWHRESAKTSCLRVFTLAMLLLFPLKIRICFSTGSDALAIRQLESVKSLLKSPTPKLRYLFPEFVTASRYDKREKRWVDCEPDWGTQHGFNLPCRRSVLPEPSVSISTPESVNAGSRYDLVLLDDLVNDQNYQSAAALAKCWSQYLAAVPLVAAGGYMIITGTRYAPGDTYEKIVKRANENAELNTFKISVRDCWSKADCRCGHADVFHDRNVNVIEPPCRLHGCQCRGFQPVDDKQHVLFPQVRKRDGEIFGFTVESLERKRAEVGQEFFALQYENNPLGTGRVLFPDELLDRVTLMHENQLYQIAPQMQSQVFLIVDPAYSENPRRDMTVVLAFAKCHGRLIPFACDFGRWLPAERNNHILEFVRLIRPVLTFIEKNVGFDTDSLRAAAPKFGLAKIDIVLLETSNKKGAKEKRLEKVEIAMQNDRVFLCAWMRGYKLMREQLQNFKHTPHDDLADVLGLMVEAPTNWQLENPPVSQAPNPMDWIRKLNSVEPVAEDYPDSGGGNGLNCGG
jgi:hypothetical protein